VAQSAPKFARPERIEGDGVTAIQIGGGNFLPVLCTRDGHVLI
jgi:hypothetical protein